MIPMLDKMEDSDYKNDLIQRNYNNGEKFVTNLTGGFLDIFNKAAYGGYKLTGAMMGIDDRRLDKTMLQVEEATQNARNVFQKDITFENAFSVENFGTFVTQEFANQASVFATLAIPTIGIPMLGYSSAADNWLEMVKEEEQSDGMIQNSLFKKAITSAAYGGAEIVFDRFLTLPVMKRGWKSMYGNKSNLLKGLDGIKQHFIKNGKRQLLYDPALEISSEVLTTGTQNIFTGKPITENMGHAAFSGGMFGYMFSGTPFIKGLVMNQFSDSKTKKKYRSNLSEISDLQKKLDDMDYDVGTKKILEDQLNDLKGENKQILENLEKKLSNLSPKWTEQYLSLITKQQSIRLSAEKIINNKNMDNDTKNKALDNLEKQFSQNQSLVEALRDPNAFGNKYNGFLNSQDKTDIDRKNNIFKKASDNLIQDGKSDPSEKQIREEARIIYNTQEINKAFNERRKKTGLAKSMINSQTVNQAVEDINNLENVSEEAKKKAIKGIQNGGHGVNLPTTDGKFISLQVVENMAKDDRLETRTHELGHTIFGEAFSNNPEAFAGMAAQIEQHVQIHNPNLHKVLVAYTTKNDGSRMDPEETLTVFMELVAEGKFDLKSKKNTGVGALMGWMFGDGVRKATNSDVDFNFEGETDAVTFVTQLAKKIKAGTLTMKERKAIGRSSMAETTKVMESLIGKDTKTRDAKMSEALKKNTVQIVNENKNLYGQVVDQADKKGIDRKNLRDAVTPRIREGLVMNNLAIANKLAKNAYESGIKNLRDAGVPNYVSKAIAKEDWQSGFIEQLITLANSWDPSVNPEFGAYVNDILPRRYGQILESLKDQIDSFSLSALEEAGFDAADTRSASPSAAVVKQVDGKKIAKIIGVKPDNIKEITDNADLAKLEEEKSYKKTKALVKDGSLTPVLELFGNEFGIPINKLSKNADLNGQQRNDARKKIAEIAKDNNLIDMLPEAQDVDGRATGVANTKLGEFYRDSGQRVKVGEGATKSLGQKNRFDKIQSAPNEDFFKLFGMDQDGNPIGKGTKFDGAIREFVVQLATLGANQQIRLDKPSMQEIGRGRSEVMFSEKVNAIINVRDSFELETKGVDKLLSGYELAKSFNLRDENGREAFVKAIEEDLLPLMPKDFWFGEDSTVFTASNKIYGLSVSKYKDGDVIPKGKKIGDFKYPDQAAAYNDLRDRIKALKNKKGVKFGKDVKDSNGNVIDFKVSSYTTLFETPAKIEKNLANGNIDKFNEKVSIIHREMWNRFNKAIRADKTGKIAPIIGTYLKLVGSDTSHWHKLGAQFIGYSTNITGARFEYEHAMPATAAYLYLLDASLSGNDFNASYDLVMDNYKLIALDKAMDKKLTAAKLQKMMPKDWSVIDNNWWDRYFNSDVFAVDNKGINPSSIKMLDGKTFAETNNIKADGNPKEVIATKTEIKRSKNAVKAHNNIVKHSQTGKTRGMSTFDFDETVGVSENYIIAKKGKETKKIASSEWPMVGDQLAKEGWDFDFTDFNKVTKGKPGPLLQKMKNQIKKYGPNNVFILTARAPESQKAIHDWLRSEGVYIPINNITGLGNSTGQAKADWMLEKFAEGYNDMYFVDDALPNVKAVKNVLDQLDVKSKVVQAKVKLSGSHSVDFNKMIERTSGVGAKKVFSKGEAVVRGADIGKWDLFVPPSAEDFKGLMYKFLGKGKQGNADMKWFKDNLFTPFAEGIRSWNTYKQNMSNEYAALKKRNAKLVKELDKKVPGTNYTVDTAIRTYLWNKNDMEIPGMAESTKKKLLNHIGKNNDLINFAETLGVISRSQDGYIQPSENWMVESIASDLFNTVKIGRQQFLGDWINNKNEIFSKENLNKIEAIHGSGFRDALENILYRMENGTNRVVGKDKTVNKFVNWINGSVGAIMFLNIRSAALQTISTVNFINWGDNNIFKASKAFANLPQFSKDFVTIFNSDMLKQRRGGSQIDISHNELADAFSQSRGKVESVIRWMLEKGFEPTRIADSFAISFGGASFYRNRINTYVKNGMSKAEAESQAWLDFQEVAEETQQSSRPDLISGQQAGVLGRIILPFQNTPMQMTRLMKKAALDLKNGRGDTRTNISKIIYYGAIQNLIFGALQSGLAFALFGGGSDEDDERKRTQGIRVLDGAIDTLLRGTGVYGAAVAALKNTIKQWRYERKQPWAKRDDMRIALQAVSLSPPMGSKLRKLNTAIKTEKYNKGVGKQIGFRIENPNLSIASGLVEGLTNFPMARIQHKMNNLEEAITGNHDLWKRVALSTGWSMWSVGVKDEELERAKVDAEKERRENRKIEKEKRKAEEKKAEEERKKREGIKTVQCSGIRSNGQRCGLTTETKAKTWKCPHHMEFKDGMDRDGDGLKEYRCTAIKTNGKRCNNKTENKNKKCYAHQ